ASGQAPSELEVAFDGQPLEVADPRRVELPAYVGERIHFVTAALRFPDGSSARAEATFGGVYGSEINSELTAVPVRLSSGEGEPTPARAAGWLEHRGSSLRVVAVEKGAADVVLVREQGTEDLVRRLRAAGIRRTRKLAGRGFQGQGNPEILRHEMSLGVRDRLIFLWPVVEQQPHPRFSEVSFFDGQSHGFDQGGFFWFLTRLYPLDRSLEQGRQLLADAVAVAGRRAASADRRRAVVLVTGRKPEDGSRLAPESSRGYLRSLGVPFHVWTPGTLLPGDAAEAWGEARPVQSLERLRRAFRELEKDLESQRILWVEGRYLPHEIERGRAAPRGVDLLASRSGR
ncbi:MAG: hypothetical protein MI919_01425, partial [Holophagales bacterium]|nr:hypothetical protein [Holophagales bacterium]